MKATTPSYVSTFKTAFMSQSLFSFLSKKKPAEDHQNTISKRAKEAANSLFDAQLNREYQIKDVVSDNKEIINFLFTLGCFKGETVTVISVLSETYVINIKDARYSIDADLAKSVQLI